MSHAGQKVLSEIRQLPEGERTEIIGMLIEEFDYWIDHDVEQAWDQEIKKRLDEIDSGNVEMIPWEKVQADIEEKLRAKRDILSRG